MNYINKDSVSVSLPINTREDSGVTLNFVAYEDGNKDVSIDLGGRTLVNNSYYQSIIFDASGYGFKDEVYYNLEATNDSDEVVYRGRVFVTSQDISAYKVNNDDFTQDNSSDNEYIMY